MKLIDIKLPTFIISALTIMLLSGCGSSGTPSDTQLVQGAIQDQAPYVIETHHESTAVVHSHVHPSVEGTHQWTQISGPAVTIATPTNQTATIPVSSSATAPIVVQHTHTDSQTGQVSNTQHTIVPVAATSTLSVIVSNPISVLVTQKASLHASTSGGTAPYTYVWQQTQGTTVTIDETYPSAPTFIVPRSTAPDPHQNETLTFIVRVLDSAGAEVSATESIISVSPFIVIDTGGPLGDVVNSKHGGANHRVGRGPLTITNALAGETYLWDITQKSGTPSLINLRMEPTANTIYAFLGFDSPDVNVSTTYDFQITVKNSTNTRLGFIDTQITVKP